ncbi:MAG: formylmethanofuran dehydrogenase subunit E family protein [Candidatus Riflebacteria bacterium]|nr:formylmethanofuran dehydrogenase subunit E family protein [Candidatus Riflebacteria bacterium]
MYSEIEKKKFADECARFHTKDAPGLVIGVEMIDFALDIFGKPEDKILAVVETAVCLPDVIQTMLGCTLGNRNIKVIPSLGRYAVTIYDRKNGRGVRVAIDLSKIDKDETPEIFKFFHRTRDPEVETNMEKRKISGSIILSEFYKVGRKILKTENVNVKIFGKPEIPRAATCQVCFESFLQKNADQEICLYCSKEEQYYTFA